MSATPWSADLDTILNGVVAEHTKAYQDKAELYHQALGETITVTVQMTVETVEHLFACGIHYADHTCEAAIAEILHFAFSVMNGAGERVEEVFNRLGISAADFEIGPEDEL